MELRNARAIILAAGRSCRFKTDKSKLLYPVCGHPMILYPIKLLKKMGIPITIVVGYQFDQIIKVIKDEGIEVDFVKQDKPLGTGHALALTRNSWDKKNILILNGDGPLLTEELLGQLIDQQNENKLNFSFLSAHAFNPLGYGRVIKEDGKISIVEEKNCTGDQRYTTLINAGVYLINKDFLLNNIDKIKKNEVSGEYYLTDLVNLASEQGEKIETFAVPYDNIRGVNTLEELWAVEQIKRSQIIKYWMNRGVRFELPQNVHLDWDVEIGAGSIIGSGVHLRKGSIIGKNCYINAFSVIVSTVIGDNSWVYSHSVIYDSKIGKNSKIGPFARLRNSVEIGDNVNIGNFVEIKNSKIEDNTNAKHLTYLGDSLVGKNVNIGAGSITCNYDGFKKHKTVIGDNSFIGTNNSLVAPIKIGNGAYTAAGSTINKNVPSNSLGIARCRQQNKIDFIKNFKSKKSIKKKDEKKSNEESKILEKDSNSKISNKVNFVGAVKTKDLQNL